MTDKAPKTKIEMQNDTIQSSSIQAYYYQKTDTITYNIPKNNKQQKFPEPTIAHENKHRQTAKSGVMEQPMSLAQYSKLNLYDEISANITELLYLRQIIIENPSKQAEIEKEYSYLYAFYFNAIKKGDIKLNSTDPKEFEKEMAFIGRQTQNMWITNYAPAIHSYLKTNVHNMNYYLKCHSYEQIKDNPVNYNKAKKEMLTIGGIDFSKYMPDLQLSNKTAQKADQMIASDFLRKDVHNAIGYWNDIKIDMNPKLSATQQYNLACHKFFVENVILRYCRHMNLSNPYDKNFFIEHVKFRIDSFEEALKKKPEAKKEWEAKKQDMAKQICAQNEITPFNTDGNNIEFSKELSKIYTFQDINILNYSKNKNNLYKLLPNHTIPKEIQAIDSTTTFEYYWDKALDFFGFGDEKPTYSPPQPPKLSAQQKAKNRQATHYPAKSSTPQYPTWTPNKRVSKVKNVELYDFSQPFLKEHLDNLIKQKNKNKDKQDIKKQTTTKKKKYKKTAQSEYINIGEENNYYWITKEEYAQLQQEHEKLQNKLDKHDKTTSQKDIAYHIEVDNYKTV